MLFTWITSKEKTFLFKYLKTGKAKKYMNSWIWK